MIDPNLISQFTSLGIAALALIISVINSSKKDTKEDTAKMTTVIVKLDNISAGIVEIKANMETTRKELQDVRDIAVKAEASASSAHKRLDMIESKPNE